MANNFGQLPIDLFINGTLSALNMVLPTASVNDNSVIGAAGIQASKLQHQHEHIRQYQDSTANAAVSRGVIHVVRGATATIVEFKVGAVVAATGNATATIDLKKNGTTILTSTITLDSTTAAFILKSPAGFTSTSAVAGDVLEFHITAATVGTGTLAQGVFAVLNIREDAQ